VSWVLKFCCTVSFLVAKCPNKLTHNVKALPSGVVLAAVLFSKDNKLPCYSSA
jgi:hypothetical protein